jgi:DsbC/DsbD-like thiol-disulfide interchange protein
MRNHVRKGSLIRPLAALIILTLAANSGAAPAGQEVQVITSIESFLSRDAIRPGEVFKAAVILEIKKGYHINDSAPLDEFLYPTSLDIEDAAGIELVEIFYPAGRRTKVDYSDVEVAVYEGRVILGLLLKAA